MQMVHIKDEFIKSDGTVDYLKVIAAIAAGKQKIYAVLSILFKVDNKKPQVCLHLNLYLCLKYK
jgi:hypothetical protein